MNMLIWSRLQVILRIPFYAVCMLMAGCSWGESLFAPKPPTLTQALTKTVADQGSEPLGMLSYIGGIAILGGIVAMVISSGRIGGRALLIGLGLILLNYAVSRYADWIFVPVLIGTGAISLTYAFLVVRKALLKKKENCNG